MFYYNTKYQFSLPANGPQDISGSVIAASAMPRHQLRRRSFRGKSFMDHRLFDPQLYLAGIQPTKTAIALSTYPWFAGAAVPEYDSGEHGSMKAWKDDYSREILREWSGRAVEGDQVAESAKVAVQLQLEIGCEAVILPSPLTEDGSDYAAELGWLDAGLAACEEHRVSLPIFATVALRDSVLRGAAPSENAILHTIADQITSTPNVAGIYLVVELGNEDGYCFTHFRTVGGVFRLVKDVVEGAGKRVVMNYSGALGAIATAFGAEIWSTGYYRSQRRLKLSDFEEDMGLARPRYFSPGLLGDVGVEKDLLRIQRANLGARVFHATPAAEQLHLALAQNQPTSAVPEWAYKPSNVQLAAGHYMYCKKDMDRWVSLRLDRRKQFVHAWLERAAQLATAVDDAGINHSQYTELRHQQQWLRACEEVLAS